MAKKRASRKTELATASLVGEAKLAVKTKPALSPVDLHRRVLKLLPSIHADTFFSLQSDFVFDLIQAVAQATLDTLESRETLTDEERKARYEVQLAQNQAARIATATENVNWLFDLMLPRFEQQKFHPPEAFRAELIQQVASGSLVEWAATATATNLGALKSFLESRQLPRYSEALRSIQAIRGGETSRFKQQCKASVAAVESGASIETERQKFLDLYQDVEARAKTAESGSKKRFQAEWFANTVQAALEYYWLPLSLWRKSYKEVRELLAATPAAQFIQLMEAGKITPEQEAILAAEGTSSIAVRHGSLLAGLSRGSGFTEGAFNTAKARIRKAKALSVP